MAREIIPHELKDWSQIPGHEAFWEDLELGDPERNFGIHRYQDRLWTSGYIGVGRMFDRRGKPVVTNGKEHILLISPQYGVNPWKMLETVMSDEEYGDYLEELEAGQFLFRVFYDQPLIRLAQDARNDGDLLYAISFVSACYALCKKGLKKELYRKEENYASKVRGKICVRKNIRENTARGRNDRFYCQYIDFTEDTVENRILKATMLKCKRILSSRLQIGAEMAKRMGFCMNVFRRVKLVPIKLSDFNAVSTTGLYTYYRPLLCQAKCIYSQKYYAYRGENGETVTRSVFTVPYLINMERLFELYARTLMKRVLEGSPYYLDRYSRHIYLQAGVTHIKEAARHIHLIPYCIPDLLIRKKETDQPVFVLDAKYKAHNRSARADTHQLLSYVLLTGARRCGFLFPGDETAVKRMDTGEDHLRLLPGDLAYYELILGDGDLAGQIGPMMHGL